MTNNFFNDDFQDYIKKTMWGDNKQLFEYDYKANFYDYYTLMDNSEQKSMLYKFNNFWVNSHVAWWFPRHKKNLTLKISFDKKSLDSNTGYETGFSLKMPYGIECDREKDKNTIYDFYISKQELIDKDLIILNFKKTNKYRSGRKYNSFILSPESGINNSYETAKLNNNEKNLLKDEWSGGWNAIHAEKIDSNSLKVYATDLPYRKDINFNNLICNLEFSESLESVEMGFNDLRGYFS